MVYELCSRKIFVDTNQKKVESAFIADILSVFFLYRNVSLVDLVLYKPISFEQVSEFDWLP